MTIMLFGAIGTLISFGIISLGIFNIFLFFWIRNHWNDLRWCELCALVSIITWTMNGHFHLFTLPYAKCLNPDLPSFTLTGITILNFCKRYCTGPIITSLGICLFKCMHVAILFNPYPSLLIAFSPCCTSMELLFLPSNWNLFSSSLFSLNELIVWVSISREKWTFTILNCKIWS